MDESAGSALRRHYAQIFRYVRRRTETREQAEDVTQAVFADAAARLGGAAAGSPPALAWLYTVAQRRLADRARWASRNQATIASLDAVRVASAGDAAYGPALADAIRRAIEQLPPGQRRVVVMKLLEGRSFRDIARRVGASEAACKMRFARGLESLRDDLRQRGLEP